MGTFSTSLRKVNIPSECKAIWAPSENHLIKGDSEIQFDKDSETTMIRLGITTHKLYSNLPG